MPADRPSTLTALAGMVEALESLDKYVGCGDNSCAFKRPTGMATNGGCRCKDRPFVIPALAKLYGAVRAFLSNKPPEGR